MRMGYMTWGMPTVPVPEAIAAVADLGFQAIELTILPNYTAALERLDRAARTEIVRLLDAHGLELPAIAAHFGLLATPGPAADRQMEDLRQSVRLAVDLARGGVPPCIDTTAGARPEQWPEVRDRLAARTAEICRYARPHGVTVAIEPHVHSCLDRPERVLWLLGAVGADNLRLNLDISHFDVQGMDIDAVCEALGPWTAHTHVKDERGRAPDFEFLIPGEGTFDCPRFLRAMRRVGYAGAITAEISIMVQKRPEYDPFDAAARTYRWMRAAFAAAGEPVPPGGPGLPSGE